MKSFEIKLYSRTGLFKKAINPRNVSSEISFSEELEGGQGDILLTVEGDFSDFLSTDIVEIREVDDENKEISMTYTGIIEEVGVEEFEGKSLVNIQILGLFTALNDMIFKQGGNRVFTASMTPGNLVKAIIDSFNADYGLLSGGDTQNLSTNLIRYTPTSIDVTGTAANYSFDNDSCLDAIKKALESKGFSLYIGADGVCYVQQDSNQLAVGLTMGRQIIKVDRKVHKREMVNTLYHERAGAVEQTYSDAGSISIFGKKEKKEVNSDIQNATTQNTVGNEYVAEHAFERNEISILMKPQKSESITPGMLLTINNISIPLINKKITKISKGKESWTLYVGDFISFANSVLKK